MAQGKALSIGLLIGIICQYTVLAKTYAPVVSSRECSEQLSSDKRPVVIKFFASWCPSCSEMEPLFEQLAKKHGHDLLFLSVNIDRAASIATEYGIQGIPTIIFLDRNHIEKDRVVGMADKELLEKKITKIKEV